MKFPFLKKKKNEEVTEELETLNDEQTEELEEVSDEVDNEFFLEDEEDDYQEVTEATIGIETVDEVEGTLTGSTALVLNEEDEDDDEYEYITPRYGLNAVLLTLGCVLAGAAIVFIALQGRLYNQIKEAYLEQGYILTNDAFAGSEDIAEGKTAYVNGQMVIGTFVPLDTSNATATASDIIVGYTAYVNGVKVVGTIPTFKPTDNYNPGEKDIVIAKGQYIDGDIIISGSANYTDSFFKNYVRKGIKIYDKTGDKEME